MSRHSTTLQLALTSVELGPSVTSIREISKQASTSPIFLGSLRAKMATYHRRETVSCGRRLGSLSRRTTRQTTNSRQHAVGTQAPARASRHWQ